ncbi:flagellar hook-length control protein FliK [Thalassobacter stenotrophicus]|uniref:Flagellar hook-length control protein FliK n=2 Tax=Thalassobacter stenotrophicus TaxID=266809 RepID=A0A0P1FGG2_9RHOB|nr:flagellar hook-length control protein FliK [Thalassobacter stenotrophicus]PVZ50039.1 flagellar hook-length control protein FliK [Thalassobacter stenotrophicus]CUH59145.1 Flagellar hook-length control protein FliK [Thalassobacter stenotrophicus]SHI94894.1 hook-length control protein FliK [Thalassobacter stenotrophicus DSM 16310]
MVDLNLNPSLSSGRSAVATGRMVAPELKSEFDAALTNAGDTQAVGTVSRDPAIAPSSNALERDEFVGLDKRQEGELPTGSSDMAFITNSTHEKMEGLTLGGALHGTPHISIADFNEMDVSPKDSSLEAVAATGFENEQAMDDGVDEGRFEPQAAVLEPLLKPTQVSVQAASIGANSQGANIDSDADRDVVVTVPNEAAAQVTGKGEKLGVYPDTDIQRSVDGGALDAKRSGSKLSLLETRALTAAVAGSNASFGQKTLMSVSVERELGVAGFAVTGNSVNSVGLADSRATIEQVLAAGKQGSTVEAKSLAPPSLVIPSESPKITQPISPRLEMQGALANRVDHTKIVGADQGYAGSVSNTKGEPIAMAGSRGETNAPPGRSLLTAPSSFHPTVPINDGDTQRSVKVGQYAGQIDGQATRPSQGSLPNQGIAESGLQLTKLPSSPKSAPILDISVQLVGPAEIKSDKATASIEKQMGIGSSVAASSESSMLMQSVPDGVMSKMVDMDHIGNADRPALPKPVVPDIDIRAGRAASIKDDPAVSGAKKLQPEAISTVPAPPQDPKISPTTTLDPTYDVREMGPAAPVGINQTTSMMPVAVAQVAPMVERSLRDTGRADGDLLIATQVSSEVQSSFSRSPESISRNPATPLPQEVLKIAEQLRAGARMDRYPLEIALDPPELGQVRMVLQTSEATTTLLIIADRPETAELMRRHANFLHEAFAEEGRGDLNLQFGTSSDAQQDASQGKNGSSHAAQEEAVVDISPNALPAGPSTAARSNSSTPNELNLTF